MAAAKKSWNEILAEANATRGPDAIRRKYLKALHKFTGRNIICYCSGWLQKASAGLAVNEFAITDYDKNGFMAAIYKLDPQLGLDLVLHTPGGSIGAAESIVDYLHSIFGTDIRVIVPQLAMSAGTLMALAAFEIVMGKQSSLGPTDPQLGGASAGAIIDSLSAAHADMAENPGSAMVWQPLLARYTPHLIVEARQAIIWSQTLATKWLARGMFQKEMTKNVKQAEAAIARIVDHLSTHNQTLSHDRHLSMETAQALGLKVVELERDQKFQDAVLRVHHCNMITLAQTSCYKFVENHEGRGTFNQINMPAQLASPPRNQL